MFGRKTKIARQADALKKRIKKHADRSDETFRVGVEIEACLIDDRGKSVSAKSLIDYVDGTEFELDSEYGKSQFEYKTEPVSMNDLEMVNSKMEEFIEHLDRALDKVYQNRKVMAVFLGANPSPFTEADPVTDKLRYRQLSKWQSKLPDVEIDGLHFKAMHIATSIQGFHLHLQGKNPDYTASMFNHILNLIPSAILVGANSRLFAGRILSFHEPRIHLYDQSEQQNSGFPSISRYLGGVEDYVDYIVSRKPNVAKDYFEMVKERHDDARIRLNTGFYRVETRVMSVQPTPKTMMAMAEFFIGYLYHALKEEVQLRPLSALREERAAVIRSGFGAKTHFSVAETARKQLSNAKKGLSELGVKVEFLSILDKRIENKSTAGEYVAKLWHSRYNGSQEETVAEVVADIWDKTRNNKPIA